MDEKTKLAIAKQASNSVFEHLSQFSICIIDTNDQDDPVKGNWKIFSGTLLEVGNRLLIATASHCIRTAVAPTRYWILSDQPRFKSDGVPGIVAAWSVSGNSPDVGILEVDRSTWQGYSSKSACQLERIRIVGLGRPQRWISLIGSPSQDIQHETRGNAKGLKAVVLSYSTSPLDRSEWSRYSIQPAPDSDVDIFLDYPDGSTDTTRLDTGAAVALPNPEGMSGGGLWDQGFGLSGPEAMWSPNEAFLFGIQSAWHPKERYVRAVQIIHWLRLVHKHYPELHNELEHQFPELKSQRGNI